MPIDPTPDEGTALDQEILDKLDSLSPQLGQKTKDESYPVVIASDQGPIQVEGIVVSENVSNVGESVPDKAQLTAGNCSGNLVGISVDNNGVVNTRVINLSNQNSYTQDGYLQCQVYGLELNGDISIDMSSTNSLITETNNLVTETNNLVTDTNAAIADTNSLLTTLDSVVDDIKIAVEKPTFDHDGYMNVHAYGVTVNAGDINVDFTETNALITAGNASLSSIDGKLSGTLTVDTGLSIPSAITNFSTETTLADIKATLDSISISQDGYVDVDAHLGSLSFDTSALATHVLQTEGNASLASIDDKTPALVSGSVPVHVDNQVSLSTVESSLSDIKTVLDSISISGDGYIDVDAHLGTINVDTSSLATEVTVSAIKTQVDKLSFTEANLLVNVDNQISLATVEGSLSSIDGKLTGVSTEATLADIKATLDSISISNDGYIDVDAHLGTINVDTSALNKEATQLDVKSQLDKLTFSSTKLLVDVGTPSVSVSNFPTTQPISGSISFTAPQNVVVDSGSITVNTISGFATSAKQETTNDELADIHDVLSTLDGKVTACNTSSVTIASSALPTGASTSANQTTANSSLSSIDGKLSGTLTVDTGLTIPAAITGFATETTLASVKTQTDKLTFSQDGYLKTEVFGISATIDANGLAEEATLSALNGKFGSLGQKAMTGSAPVVLASDQSALHVIVDSGGGSNDSVSNTGSAVPTKATYIGAYNASGNLTGLKVDANGKLETSSTVTYPPIKYQASPTAQQDGYQFSNYLVDSYGILLTSPATIPYYENSANSVAVVNRKPLANSFNAMSFSQGSASTYSGVIKNGAGRLYGIHCNVLVGAATLFLHFFNLTAVPANSSLPLMSLAITPYYSGQTVYQSEFSFPDGIYFDTGLCYCVSSTGATLTAATSNFIFLGVESA